MPFVPPMTTDRGIQECASLYSTGDFNGFTSGLAKLTEREMLVQDKIASWRGLEAYLTKDEMQQIRSRGSGDPPLQIRCSPHFAAETLYIMDPIETDLDPS